MVDAPEVQADGGAVSADVIESAEHATRIDPTAPEVQELISKAIEAATKDTKKIVSEFRENNLKLMRELDSYKASGLPSEQVQKIAAAMEKNKELKLANEGKWEDIVALRVEPLRRDLEAQRDAERAAKEDLAQRNKELKAKNFDLIVGAKVASAVAANPDVHASATSVINEFARKVWLEDENGQIRPYRPNGAPWIAKDAKSDISFEEWIEELRPIYPFLFKAPQGVQARGGPGKTSLEYIKSIPNPINQIEEMRKAGLKG